MAAACSPNRTRVPRASGTEDPVVDQHNHTGQPFTNRGFQLRPHMAEAAVSDQGHDCGVGIRDGRRSPVALPSPGRRDPGGKGGAARGAVTGDNCPSRWWCSWRRPPRARDGRRGPRRVRPPPVPGGSAGFGPQALDDRFEMRAPNTGDACLQIGGVRPGESRDPRPRARRAELRWSAVRRRAAGRLAISATYLRAVDVDLVSLFGKLFIPRFTREMPSARAISSSPSQENKQNR